MKKKRYLRIGKEKRNSTVGVEVREIPEVLFLCNDGENHQESFETLKDILSAIFLERNLIPPKPAKEYTEKGNYQMVWVREAYLGLQKCALFESKKESILVRKQPSSSYLIKEWIKQVKYYLP